MVLRRRIASLVGVSLVATSLLPAPSATAAATGHLAVSAFGRWHSGIYMMRPDGSESHRVFDLTNRDWGVGGHDLSADGSMLALAFSPQGKTHIYLVNADGSDFHQLTSGGDDYDPSFSPDGEWLVFTRSIKFGPGRLYRVRTDGTGLKRLTGPHEPEANFASWSPDGSMIAFVELGRTRQRLIVTDSTGTWFRFLLSRPRRAGQFFNAAWSPDSSTITFAMYEPNFLNADLWSIQADGTGLTQITATPKVAEVSPAYSPDGSMLAASLQNELQGWADVLLMNADGTGRQRLRTARDEYHISWGA